MKSPPVQKKVFLLWLFCVILACNKDKTTVQVNSSNLFPKVKVIIAQQCLSCHSSSGIWSGRPTSFDSDSSIALQAHAIKSAIADSVTVVNKRMPANGSLNVSDSTTIILWYLKGGKVSD